jgi:hypothetical protein
MRVAVALDSGEVVATGYGHFGTAVARCGRILERAGGGQVLLSEATRNLLEGEYLGELEVRSLAGTFVYAGGWKPGGARRGGMPIYEIIVPGIPRPHRPVRKGGASAGPT